MAVGISASCFENINGNSHNADGFDAKRQWARITGTRLPLTTRTTVIIAENGVRDIARDA